MFTQKFKRIASILLCAVITLSAFSASFSAFAVDYGVYNGSVIQEWMSRADKYGEFGSSGKVGAFGGGRGGGFASNVPKNYYTTPTESKEDKYGNVTNYYRGGDTTSTKIIDSYNHTFNTIHNTNTTNNYSANVKLSDFLNTYTTVNNDYTYNTQFKSWYYDNTQNTLNYSDNDTFYSLDNRQYYVSIDNSTDEYYLVDVKYSPTFVTVNYTYNTTNNNTTNNYGDVTNIYYFELTDGRNSSTLSASEVAGLDLGYDVAPYVLVPDDPNTLSLQHFDGDYTDSSSYGRDFYSVNRSTNYVDSGAFGRAVQLPSGSAAGVTIPGLSGYDKLSFDFRVYYSDIANLGIYFGDTCLFQQIPSYMSQSVYDYYKDDGNSISLGRYCQYYSSIYDCPGGEPPDKNSRLDLTKYDYTYSNVLKTRHSVPSINGSGWAVINSSYYGWYIWPSTPTLYNSSRVQCGTSVKYTYYGKENDPDHPHWHYYNDYTATIRNYTEYWYRVTPQSVKADFSYATYKNQWVPMRITISGGKLYYFVNGDLVGSGDFTKPTADKFYIKSSGTLYLDELRVTTGDLTSTGAYTPSSSPYDTNKVLALPDAKTANTIYVRHSTPVSAYRIGGVRPSNPTTGFFYIPLHDDYTGGQPQLYDGSNWVDVEAMVYDGSTVKSALGYVFTPVGSSPDVDADLKPERPTKPGEDVDPDTCQHEWKETSRKEASCTLAGSIIYTCEKCRTTKTETIPKLGHSWEVKTSVQTTYDETGNLVTQGYTIYRCTVCGEEYKDTDGTGPPVPSTPDTPDDGEGNWFTKLLKKIGDFFGTTIGGLLDLIGAALGKILDSLITLVENTIGKLKELVNLFGSFGEALGVLWTWLPPEIMTVLVAGVTVFIFVALLKLFLK